jgi:Na+-driven multidrug efflux pump
LVIVGMMQPVNAAVFVGDGVFQGAADFQYLAIAMLLACGVAAIALVSGDGSLSDVWKALLALQLARGAAITLRYVDAVPWPGQSPLKLPEKGQE